MKQFLFLLLLASCVQSEMITVTVGIAADFKVTRNGVFQLTSIVSDFDHVYDSVSFSATNLANNKQTLLSGSKVDFNFAASPGDYNLYIGTPGISKSISRFVLFSASVPSVAISSTNKNIVLPSDTQHGLILITKAGVEGTPKIKVGTKEQLMYSSTKYWYAYVQDDGNGAKITTTISGVLLDNIVIGVTKGVVYVFNPLGANAKADDPFKVLQQI
jgi:hypothetical protein